MQRPHTPVRHELTGKPYLMRRLLFDFELQSLPPYLLESVKRMGGLPHPHPLLHRQTPSPCKEGHLFMNKLCQTCL